MQPDFFPVQGIFHGTGGFFDKDFVKNKKQKKSAGKNFGVSSPTHS